MTFEQLWPALSVLVAILAFVFTSLLLSRQLRQMEHERNALAILEAINRLTDPAIVAIFDRLVDIDARYPTEDDLINKFYGSKDWHDFLAVGQYIETIACLARRGVLDPSLIVDAVGLALRQRWMSVSVFVLRQRQIEHNEYILENFEWLARYSAWWKDTPRPKRDRNYDPQQFKGVIVTR